MKKEYEILYGSDFGRPNDKMLITLEEEKEKDKLIPLICMIANVIDFADGFGIDVLKDNSAITIFFYIEKVQIEVQSGELTDWNFNISDIIKIL